MCLSTLLILDLGPALALMLGFVGPALVLVPDGAVLAMVQQHPAAVHFGYTASVVVFGAGIRVGA